MIVNNANTMFSNMPVVINKVIDPDNKIFNKTVDSKFSLIKKAEESQSINKPKNNLEGNQNHYMLNPFNKEIFIDGENIKSISLKIDFEDNGVRFQILSVETIKE